MRFVSVIVIGQPCLMTHSIPGEIRSFSLSMFWSVILSPGTTSARTGVPSIASESEATPARVSHQRGLAMVPSPSATWLRARWLYNASPAGVNGTSALAADRSVHVGRRHVPARDRLDQVGRDGRPGRLDHRPAVRVAPGDHCAPAASQPDLAQLPRLEGQEALALGLALRPLDPAPLEEPELAAEQAEQDVQDEDLPPAHAPSLAPSAPGGQREPDRREEH